MTQIDRRTFLGAGALALTAGVLSPVLAGCAGADSPGTGAPAGPALSGAALEEAAKAEGIVRAYITDQRLADEITAGFSKKYPWAKVETVVGSQTTLRNRAITESVSGAATADVLNLSNQRSALLKNNIVRAVPLEADKNYPSSLLDSQNYAHPLYQYVVLFAYNKNLVPSAPASMEDLADPSWRGKIAFDKPQNASTATTFLVGKRKQWGDEKWTQWLEALKANQILLTPNAATALAHVQSGERPLGLSSSIDVLSVAPGSPVQPGYYDGLIPVVQYAWLTTKGKNPNCGQLLAEWLMGPEGQQAIAASGRSPVLDIDTPVSLKKVLPADAKIMPATELDEYYTDPTPYLDKLNQLWPA